MMLRDFRSTNHYRDILRFCDDVRQPGRHRISDGAQMHVSPDGQHAVFAASVAEQVEADPSTRLALTDLASGTTELVTDGPNNDRSPRFSNDGRYIAFLSDRDVAGRFQLYLYDRTDAVVRAAPTVRGTVEHIQWSPDGRRILLCAAAARAETKDLPAWMPRIAPAEMEELWRSCLIYDPAADRLDSVPIEGSVWGAAWCGNDALAILHSARPGEDHWYGAHLGLFDLHRATLRHLYEPLEQLGTPVASPSGATIAVVEALCSDRGPVTGDLLLVDAATGEHHRIDTQGVDILTAEWVSERQLLLSGSRGLEAVVGLYDSVDASFAEHWRSREFALTNACIGPTEHGCVIIAEGFTRAPHMLAISNGETREIASFDAGYTGATRSIAAVEALHWRSDDGLQIEGWLLTPQGPGPHPLIVTIHGGPIGHWRPTFLIRRLLHVPILIGHGYAVFLPNPRGSSGRGQAFARMVLGDLGGGDARDILSGVTALIDRGIADPDRIGITGVSYGGFMTSWLITQSDRFAAAVSISPHTNQVTARLLSNIPGFMAHLVADDLDDPAGRYFSRSPALHVRGELPPTLNICGALDRCTPPTEAVQFHQALLDNGTRSVLLTYGQEGHGIRRLPAALDCAARTIAWFVDHIPAHDGSR